MRKVFYAVLTLCLFAASAFGQTSRGTVSGTVTDPTGAVIAGASVTLKNTQTSVERAATTNDEGFYRFEAVDLGSYTVTINAPGFGELVKTNVVVNANQTSEVGGRLEPGATQVTIDVIGESGAGPPNQA